MFGKPRQSTEEKESDIADNYDDDFDDDIEEELPVDDGEDDLAEDLDGNAQSANIGGSQGIGVS